MDNDNINIINKNAFCVNKLCKKVKTLDKRVKKTCLKTKNAASRAFGQIFFNDSNCPLGEFITIFDIDLVTSCNWYAFNNNIFEFSPCFNSTTLTECLVTDQDDMLSFPIETLQIFKDGCYNVSLTGNLVFAGNFELLNYEIGIVLNPTISNDVNIFPLIAVASSFNDEVPSNICLNTNLEFKEGDKLGIYIRFEDDIGDVVALGTNWFSLVVNEI